MNINLSKILLYLPLLIVWLFIIQSEVYGATKFRISKLPDFDKLVCLDEDSSYIEFENFSFKDAIIDSMLIIGTNANDFRVENMVNIQIPRFQKTKINIVFKPLSDGIKSAKIIIFSTELENNYLGTTMVGLYAEKYSFHLDFSKGIIDFGEVEPDSIAENQVLVKNTGSLIIEFPKLPIKVGNFEIFDIIPKVLQPYPDSPNVGIFKIRFKSSDEGEYSNEIKIFDLCGNKYSFKVKAKVKKKEINIDTVKLAVGSYNGNTGEDITITFKIINYYILKSQNADKLYSKFKFNSTILHPIDNTPVGELEGNNRVINLDLDIRNDSIFTYKFKIALGNDSISKLVLYDTYSPNYNRNIENISGDLILDNLCNSSGVRLVNLDNTINFELQKINNDVAELNYELIEDGLTKIFVYDYFGNLVQIVEDRNLSKGQYRSTINLNKFGVGIFYILLQTPTYRKSINLNLVR